MKTAKAAIATTNSLIGEFGGAVSLRFVQARICDPSVSGDCVRASSNTLLPLPLLRHVPGLTFRLHMATTIANTEIPGYVPGTP